MYVNNSQRNSTWSLYQFIQAHLLFNYYYYLPYTRVKSDSRLSCLFARRIPLNNGALQFPRNSDYKFASHGYIVRRRPIDNKFYRSVTSMGVYIYIYIMEIGAGANRWTNDNRSVPPRHRLSMNHRLPTVSLTRGNYFYRDE